MIRKDPTGNTFKNPFEDINANVMDSKKILEFWCNPFTSGFLTEIKENDFYTEKMPIILEGFRGSGKTTILKYFSYLIQFELSKNREDQSFLEQVKTDGAFGIYFRCDESFINTFRIIFSLQDKSEWSIVFQHYLELFLIQNILDVYELIDADYKFESEIITDLKKEFPINISSIEEFKQFIHKESIYIDKYKNNAIFTDETFSPTNIFSLYQLSSILIKTIKEVIIGSENINVLFLIDEFENLDDDLQRMFNSLIKFSRTDISLRIGRRSEGLITKQTINEDEYLRENHDYTLISLKDRDMNEVKSYFLKIAEKRFSSIKDFFPHEQDAKNIFGIKEDLDWEALTLAKDKKDHIYQILRTNNELSSDNILLEKVVSTIEFDENPIAEMLNALWVIRDKGNKLEAANSTRMTMENVFNKVEKKNTRVKKYNNDYYNKYRYALVGLMCAIYKKPKLYYSFNTICYLSNSNARMFINFCRAIINDALFYEREQFFTTKKVSYNTQSKAILEVANDEFKNVCSIIKHGNKIRNLVNNLGNVFSDYAKDKKVRYPETNQFIFNQEELDSDYKEIINVAENWAIILKKPKVQRSSIEISKKDFIYYINRSYSPIFNISYRTRGGFNVSFLKHEIQQMCEGKTHVVKLHKTNEINQNQKDYEQLSLFD